MAKPNRPSTPVPASSAFSDEEYEPLRPRLNLDGFLFVGKKEEPVFGMVKGRITNVVKRDEGSFLVLEVEAVEGDLKLANRGDDGEQTDPFVPETWAGLRVGLSGYASLSPIFEAPQEHVGMRVRIDYGGMKVNKKTGRTFREILIHKAKLKANGQPQASA